MEIEKLCQALGNETRYQIIKALKEKSIQTCCDRIEYYEEGISVADVVKVTGLAQSTVSQHLSVLESSGLVFKEKRGLWTCFFLNRPLIDQFLTTLAEELR